MRPIRFRAYLKKDKKIYNVLSFFEKFKDEEGNRVFLDKPQIEGDVTNYQVGGENVVLMQFTGRLDKNGKEIFEGDIVSGYPYGGSILSQGVIEWDNVLSAFIANFPTGQKFICDIANCTQPAEGDYSCEVTGNVYE